MTEQQVVINSNPGTSGDSNWINNNITTRVIDEYRDRESRKLKLIYIMSQNPSLVTPLSKRPMIPNSYMILLVKLKQGKLMLPV